MICKDEDVCSCCFRRRKKECNYEPFGFGPDCDGEFGIACAGEVTWNTLHNAFFNDALADYEGIGDMVPWEMLFPLMIWHGFNWFKHTEEYPQSVMI